MRNRVTWAGVRLAAALVILLLASAAFAAGAVMRGLTVGSVVFLLLGTAGIALFGAGLVVAGGGMLARRPVLEMDGGGVRRPARWPLPRRGERVLAWADVAAIAAVRRATSRGREQDYVVFLPTAELAELARTAERPRLVALTLRGVPATAEAAAWCFAVEPSWDAPLSAIVEEAGRRRPVPLIDRRTR
ncbi:hypothetical protein [Actinomadura terrae]|uniref:hypothetical protein n=1 Tax=Actinomadura terrae TaxID=604353 RepID=UPI001FA73F31|nr:hypothetical protein [Actinomadura terrae]